MRAFRAPEETRAQARTWDVVAAAFAEREPVQRMRRVPVRPLVALAVVGALAGIAFTSPGHAVLTSVRKAVGIEHPQRELYSLPTGGRLLVGPWIVNADGSTRHLDRIDDASWSPFGRFIIGTRGDGLVALTASGDVRWTLGRPVVALPRWGGTHTDTRIAYFSGQRLRIVAGDGTGDRQAVPGFVARVPPAWQPGSPFTLAYAETDGHVRVFGTADGRGIFTTARLERPRKLVWSSDGMRLLVVTRDALLVYDDGGLQVSRRSGSFADAAFLPGTHRVVALTRHAVSLGARTLFSTTGSLSQVVPSPDGRWLLLTWPDADQWLFVRTTGRHRVTAVANIAEQLGGAFRVAGWTS